eukprot:Gb_37079 [translate_table: standard]
MSCSHLLSTGVPSLTGNPPSPDALPLADNPPQAHQRACDKKNKHICTSRGDGIEAFGFEAEKLLSPENDDVYLMLHNGTFFAGFYSVGYNAYVFAIWYAQIPHKTIVWMANRDNPVNGWESTLKLNKNVKMVTLSGRVSITRQILFFYSDNIPSLSFNGFSTSTYWPDPDLVAYTSGRSHYNSQKFAVLNALGGFKSSDGYSFNTTDFGETPLRRLTLDTDGNLRAYSWDNTSLAWVVVWEAFTQLCKIHGLCGPNAICIYTPQPRCACPPSFRMANRSNWFQGCEPLFPLNNCSQQFNLIPLQQTDYYGNDLDTYRAYATFEQCQAICMNDCRCKGFAYRLDGMGKCFPKSNLYNGFQSPAVANTLYIKVSAAFPYNSSHETLLTPLNLTCPPAKANPAKPLSLQSPIGTVYGRLQRES